jgi:hypothetical protein
MRERTMTRRRAATALLAALVAATLLVPSQAAARGSRPAMAPGPNRSIVLYKKFDGQARGRLRVGSLVGAAFTQKQVIDTGRWSHIVAGRDTIALYDRQSGKLRVGWFRKGRITFTSTRAFTKGYTHVAASCDSIVFHKRGAASLRTAELSGGQMRDLRTIDLITPPLVYVVPVTSTCDTLSLRTTVTWHRGVLRDGYLETVDYAPIEVPAIHGSNRTAYFAVNAQNGNGAAFGFRFGELETAEVYGAMPFTPDIIAGAGDGMVFYDGESGQTRYLKVVGSIIDDLGAGPSLGRNITIIAGGR